MNRRRTARELIAMNTSIRVRENPDSTTWVSRYVRHHSGLLARIMPVGKKLGCGSYGCVFEAKGGGVLKVTSDRSEGALTRFVMLARKKDSPGWLDRGVVWFHGLWQGPASTTDWSSRPKNIYLILRESVVPIRSADLIRAEREEIETGRKSDLLLAVDLLMDAYEHAQAVQRGRSRSLKTDRLAIAGFARSVTRLKRIWPSISAVLEHMWTDYGILLSDVHWGNIGVATREKPVEVVFDVGATLTDFPARLRPTGIPRLR